MQGNLDRGAALLEEASPAAGAVADRRLAGILAGRISINLAVAPRAQGQYALAAAHLEEALRLEREAGYTDGMILALGTSAIWGATRPTTRGRWRSIRSA